jgi:hypothetical protein
MMRQRLKTGPGCFTPPTPVLLDTVGFDLGVEGLFCSLDGGVSSLVVVSVGVAVEPAST